LLSCYHSHTSVPSLLLCFLHSPPPPPDLHSFPTRRSSDLRHHSIDKDCACFNLVDEAVTIFGVLRPRRSAETKRRGIRKLNCFRSEEHTSELQSRGHLVCRLLLDKKKTKT